MADNSFKYFSDFKYVTSHLPEPGEDLLYDFEYIMVLVKSWDEPVEHYQDGLRRLEIITNLAFEEIKRTNSDSSILKTEAEKLKEKYRGDILPPLKYLSQFTPVCSDTKLDYLKGVLWWALTAKEYIQRNMTYQKYFGKREL